MLGRSSWPSRTNARSSFHHLIEATVHRDGIVSARFLLFSVRGGTAYQDNCQSAAAKRAGRQPRGLPNIKPVAVFTIGPVLALVDLAVDFELGAEGIPARACNDAVDCMPAAGRNTAA